MSRRRTPSTVLELPAERVLRTLCRYYMQYPELPLDSIFVRELMAFFLENVPYRRLTSHEVAVTVDQFALTATVMEARNIVAQVEGRTVVAVTRAHQRYGRPVAELRARRKAALEGARKREA